MVRVCIIGAGPSGLSALYNFEKLAKGKVEVVCYEKQETFGGLWNYTWRTGLDEHGEYVHGSMYRYLWSNGPKEASLEYPDYTFEQHYGQAIPSFPPREVLFDYLKGRFGKYDLEKYIRYEHVVRCVTFDAKTDTFSVVVKDLKNNKLLEKETFDYVINASGHFSVPNVPTFPGFSSFPGRILHSHDFRDAVEFRGKRLLIIGSSYSAEDIAMQTIKYGAQSVVVSYRTAAMGFKFPKTITERPLLVKVDGNKATFKDGSTAEVDAIVLATGYLHHYPYLSDPLRLVDKNLFYYDSLYKCTVWTKAGNGKMLYLGAMDQYNTWTMFEAQAHWAVKYITGEIKKPSKDEMHKDVQKWMKKLSESKNYNDDIDFQNDFVNDLTEASGFGTKLDVRDLFHEWETHKYQDILTYRDQRFKSIFSGTLSPAHHSSFMEAMDDSIKCYMGKK